MEYSLELKEDFGVLMAHTLCQNSKNIWNDEYRIHEWIRYSPSDNTILLIYYFIQNLSWQNKNISFMYIFAII